MRLRRFITCKSIVEGVPVVSVNSRNTSRIGSASGYCVRANRNSQACFSCLRCDHPMNADHNAAINIASRAAINRPVAA
ncbi:MAG: zinc ribbon domain-containing protein [Leptospirales bacterium]